MIFKHNSKEATVVVLQKKLSNFLEYSQENAGVGVFLIKLQAFRIVARLTCTLKILFIFFVKTYNSKNFGRSYSLFQILWSKHFFKNNGALFNS